MNRHDKQFSLVFVPTLACNCTCTHCFENIVPRTIDDDAWGPFFRKVKEMTSLEGIAKLLIYWQGGEVMTMGPVKVRRGLEIIDKIFRNTDVTVEHRLQTNLLLYDSEWKDIIKDYFRGRIGSSVDYPNLYRSTPDIPPVDYNQAWLEKKERAEGDGIFVSAVTLPNTETLRLGAGQFHSFFRDEAGVRNVQINFPFPGARDGFPLPLDLEGLSYFLEAVYDIWLSSGRYLNLNPFIPLERRMLKGEGSLSCVWSYSCGKSLMSLGPDGEVGQCDCWISTHKSYIFGNIIDTATEGILCSGEREIFLNRPIHVIDDPECAGCDFWQICHGGCPVRAYTFNGDIYSRDHYCKVYKGIFSMILEKNRFPSN